MVVKFDLNTIPNDVTVTEATLSIYPFKNYYEGENGPKSVFRLTKDWSESSVTWSSPWSTGGGDFSATALASSSNSSYNVWEDYDVTSAVKDMVESSGENCGFLFKFDSMTPKKGVSVYSSEASQTDKRPKLAITYEGGDTQAPEVTVTAPSAGQILTQGATFNITWTATDNVGVVCRAIYFDSGLRDWELVDSAAGSTGTYGWTVPDIESADCKIMINAYDAAGNVGTQETGTFTIEPPAAIKPYGFMVVHADRYNVKITNIQGREIASFETRDIKQLNKMMTSLSSGVHIIHITTPNQKFSKQIRVVK